MNLNKVDFRLIPEYYNVLFYWAFINFHREVDLMAKLGTLGYKCQQTSLILDAIFKIDLIAFKDNQTLYIQIKNQLKNFSNSELKTLRHYCINKNALPVLAYRQGTKWVLINLFNDLLFLKV